jgi:hypothetical protein
MVQLMRMSEKPTSTERTKVPLFIPVHLLLIPTNKDIDPITRTLSLRYRNMGKSEWGKHFILCRRIN